MNYFTLCVTFISLLLGMAYPMLIQITSKDKYSSDAILDLFENNKKKKCFLMNLKASLILVALAYLGLPPLFSFNIEWLDYLFGNLVKILLLILTTILIISFFRLINLIQTFYRTTKLIDFLGKQNKKIIEKNDFKYFEGMSDILYWSIQNQNLKAVIKVSSYFSEIFREYRKNWNKEKDKKNEGLIYPNSFYEMVYNTIEQSVKKDQNFKFIEARTSGLTWLLGEYKCPKISKKTYKYMWRNIVLAIENKRLDLVFMHWKSAHQYFEINLGNIASEFSVSENKLNITNQVLIDERDKEKELFLEFHYALGGLLLYKGEVHFIKKLFEYTTSQPANYPLLPTHMNQIFCTFFDSNIETKYNFPDLDGVKAEIVIKTWIRQYIGILFIRQFNIHIYYLTSQVLTKNPTLPVEFKEKRDWFNNIGHFKKIIEDKVNDKELMKTLNFKDGSEYVDKINEIKFEIEEDFEKAEKNAVPLKTKIKKYFETVKTLLLPTFESFEQIKNKEPEKTETGVFNITGKSDLRKKEAFTDNGTTTYVDYHSFLPETVNIAIKERLSFIFHENLKESYLVTQENVFKSLDKLKINSDKHIIILFGGFNYSYYTNNLGVTGLAEDNYNGIEIKHFLVNIRNIGTSLFVLEKEHLPWINFNKMTEEYVKLYELKPLNDDYKLYSSVSDFNTNIKLREVITKEERGKDKELEKYVYQSINFRTTLRFSKKLKLVRIQIKGYFDNGRKANNLNDIKKF